MAPQHRTLTYPNGLTKSYLLEVYLVAADVGSDQESFNFDLALAAQFERAGAPNCAWHVDDDGRVIVDEIDLDNPDARVVVTSDGFKIDRYSKARRQVFISYAREDAGFAETVAERLQSAGYAVWLDKEAIFGGQSWKLRIAEAIDASDHFVALVSRRSVSKTGYVHAELRRALDRSKLFPEGRVFVIPARLDECTMPFAAMYDLHYIDLFPDIQTGTDALLRALAQAHHGSRPI